MSTQIKTNDGATGIYNEANKRIDWSDGSVDQVIDTNFPYSHKKDGTVLNRTLLVREADGKDRFVFYFSQVDEIRQYASTMFEMAERIESSRVADGPDRERLIELRHGTAEDLRRQAREFMAQAEKMEKTT